MEPPPALPPLLFATIEPERIEMFPLSALRKMLPPCPFGPLADTPPAPMVIPGPEIEIVPPEPWVFPASALTDPLITTGLVPPPLMLIEPPLPLPTPATLSPLTKLMLLPDSE